MRFDEIARGLLGAVCVLSWMAAASAQDVVRLNAGGPDLAATEEESAWEADAHFAGGDVLRGPSSGIDGSERAGDFTYRIPLRAGRYHLTLLFASGAPWDGLMPAGKLAFDVRVQGDSIRPWIDARMHTPHQSGWPLVVPIEVGRDRLLTLELRSGRRPARLAGLRVTPRDRGARTGAPNRSRSAGTLVTVPYRVNVGGGELLGTKDVLWLADPGAEGGDLYSAPDPIANTRDDDLYRSERYGDFAYRIPVDNGTYEVRLHFAEIYFGVPSGDATGGPGSRLFDVTVEGALRLDDLDLARLVRPATAFAQSFRVDVADGLLDIELASVVDSAKLSAFEVLPWEPKRLRRELAVLRPPFEFPPTEVDTTSAAIDFEVRNTGLVEAKLRTKLVGPHPEDFLFDSPPREAILLLPGESWVASVRFSPSAEGERFAKLVFTPGAIASESVELRGEGRPPFDRPLRINAGGAAYQDLAGNLWEADTGYQGGETNVYPGDIEGTEDDGLYQDERYGSFTYSLAVPNGRHRVTLHFAELYWGAPGGGPGGPGQRLFNVYAEGQLEVSSLDLWSTFGPLTAGVIELEVVVDDDQLDLLFESLEDFATIAALEVERIVSLH